MTNGDLTKTANPDNSKIYSKDDMIFKDMQRSITDSNDARIKLAQKFSDTFRYR